MDDPLISVREAAQRIPLSKSTLLRQIKAGLIRSHDGLVRYSEVLEDRAKNVDHGIWAHRRKVGTLNPAQSPHAAEHASGHASPAEDEANEDDDQEISVAGEAMTLGAAKALKETYLAKLRRLEFNVKSSELVDAETAKRVIFELSRQDRDSWSNWPARVSPLIASELGVDQVKCAVILEKHVREHLAERASPALRFPS